MNIYNWLVFLKYYFDSSEFCLYLIYMKIMWQFIDIFCPKFCYSNLNYSFRSKAKYDSFLVYAQLIVLNQVVFRVVNMFLLKLDKE